MCFDLNYQLGLLSLATRLCLRRARADNRIPTIYKLEPQGVVEMKKEKATVVAWGETLSSLDSDESERRSCAITSVLFLTSDFSQSKLAFEIGVELVVLDSIHLATLAAAALAQVASFVVGIWCGVHG